MSSQQYKDKLQQFYLENAEIKNATMEGENTSIRIAQHYRTLLDLLRLLGIQEILEARDTTTTGTVAKLLGGVSIADVFKVSSDIGLTDPNDPPQQVLTRLANGDIKLKPLEEFAEGGGGGITNIFNLNELSYTGLQIFTNRSGSTTNENIEWETNSGGEKSDFLETFEPLEGAYTLSFVGMMDNVKLYIDDGIQRIYIDMIDENTNAYFSKHVGTFTFFSQSNDVFHIGVESLDDSASISVRYPMLAKGSDEMGYYPSLEEMMLNFRSYTTEVEGDDNGVSPTITASVVTDYDIDIATQTEHWNLTMTGDTNFNFTNMFDANNSKVITITLGGDYAFTFPSWLKPLATSDDYDTMGGTLAAEIVINIKNGGATPSGYYSLQMIDYAL